MLTPGEKKKKSNKKMETLVGPAMIRTHEEREKYESTVVIKTSLILPRGY